MRVHCVLRREMKKEVIVFCPRVGDHSLNHGHRICLNYLAAENLKRSDVTGQQKRKQAEWLQFIAGPSLAETRLAYNFVAFSKLKEEESSSGQIKQSLEKSHLQEKMCLDEDL